jgi:hypothetical protein
LMLDFPHDLFCICTGISINVLRIF